MTKVVYNQCHGGFSVSPAATRRAREISGNPLWGGPCLIGDEYDSYFGKQVVERDYGAMEWDRTDPVLVQVVEEMGDAASGQFAKLRIADLPEGTLYRIDEYDGFESVMTVDDYTWQKA